MRFRAARKAHLKMRLAIVSGDWGVSVGDSVGERVVSGWSKGIFVWSLAGVRCKWPSLINLSPTLPVFALVYRGFCHLSQAEGTRTYPQEGDASETTQNRCREDS